MRRDFATLGLMLAAFFLGRCVRYPESRPAPCVIERSAVDLDRIAARMIENERRIAYWRGWKRLPADVERRKP